MIIILADFCSWWWLWWIAPFLLGLLLGAILWKRFKFDAAKLKQSQLQYISTISVLESSIRNLKSENRLSTNDLAASIKLNNDLQKKSAYLKTELKRISNIDSKSSSTTKLNPTVNPTKPTLTDIGKPAISDKINYESYEESGLTPFAKLDSTNLQIIEGIGPKLELLLKDNDITDWNTLASKTVPELKKILKSQGPRYAIINPTIWPLQASIASKGDWYELINLSLIHISEPTRRYAISYAVFCLKKKK